MSRKKFEKLVLNIEPGTNIEDAIYKAIYFSYRFDCLVIFVFNEIELHVEPGNYNDVNARVREGMRKYFEAAEELTK